MADGGSGAYRDDQVEQSVPDLGLGHQRPGLGVAARRDDGHPIGVCAKAGAGLGDVVGDQQVHPLAGGLGRCPLKRPGLGREAHEDGPRAARVRTLMGQAGRLGQDVLRGLKLEGERAIPHELHQFELKLGAHYPSEPPDVTWLTPIFHPNIRGQAVCHSQQWSPAWSLADFVVELGDMIRMDKFNVKSPLDRRAAAWVEGNRTRFPLDERNLRPADVKIQVRPRPKPQA